jgi:hypothetical protein
VGKSTTAALERQVTATAGEFARGLETAFPSGLSGGPLSFRAESAGAAMEIQLAAAAERRIGGLALPCLSVRIRFTAGSPEAQADLLARMDRAMQRGGG